MRPIKVKTSKFLYEEYDLIYSTDKDEYIPVTVLMDISGLSREELLSVFVLTK